MEWTRAREPMATSLVVRRDQLRDGPGSMAMSASMYAT